MGLTWSSIEIGAIRRFCPNPGIFLGLGVLGHFASKKSGKKNYQVSMYNFMCQNFLIFPIYYSEQELKPSGLEISLVYGILGTF